MDVDSEVSGASEGQGQDGNDSHSRVPESQMESESLLADMPLEMIDENPVDPSTTAVSGNRDEPSQCSESQSLLLNDEISHAIPAVNNSEVMFKSYDESVITATGSKTAENDSTVDDSENAIDPKENDTIEETVETEDDTENDSMQIDEIDESEEVHDVEQDDDDEEEDNDENETKSTTNLPFGKIKKIMKICVQTFDPEEAALEEEQNRTAAAKKGKGKSKAKPVKTGSSHNLIITKEAVYLTTAVTELFIAAITQKACRITESSKKKTMTLDHLKRALSDSENFEFLQGCFQPSIINGD